ncbi:hypothetical protein [Geomesophilobacter sediminis]|uniref:Uncharacterized protein n=1 Tax=Geomesophilobacter sediminis TaxID=2798584 RepID=A0A8J7IZL5_9BACT|nr:hypothetical protein [Geomesophilobacter sediminis]MBJ6725537.1 hypothetical protein [Geomesophilobacter sediminis]
MNLKPNTEVSAMVSIELNKADASTLQEILESALDDLKTERVRTENREFHAHLAERERLLGNVIRKLELVEEV